MEALNLRVLYPIIDGEITGGNIVALKIMEEVLRRGGKAIVNSPSEGKFTDILRQKGIKVYNIDTRRSFRLDRTLKLVRLIKKENINLLHSHTPLAGAILSRLAGGLTGIPVINHAHMPDFINRNPAVRIFQLLLNWLTARLFCSEVIAVSEFVKSQIIKQGIASDKISVLYNGIDLEHPIQKSNSVKIRNEFGLTQGQRIIAEVARLGNDKGQHILIKAADEVIKKSPDVIFMIVGEDLTKEKKYLLAIENLVSTLGLKEKIIFTGYRADIADLMDAFDIFVLPTTFQEGLPLVILEAMAAKKPVIATAVGGNPEVVIDGQTGTLIPPEDSDKLVEAVLSHLNNPGISKEMGQRGYERVKQFFPVSMMLDRTMSIYEKLLRDL